MMNAASYEAKDDGGNLIQDYLHRGGMCSGALLLGIGEGACADGKYTTDPDEWRKVRIGDWANTPGHAFLIGDVRYDVYYGGHKKPKKGADDAGDLQVAQSSFVGDDYEEPGPVRLLTTADLDWLSVEENEAELERRLAAFFALEGKQLGGKQVERIDPFAVCEFSANALWSNSPVNGSLRTVHGKFYEFDGAGAWTCIDDADLTETKNDAHRGVSRAWMSGIPIETAKKRHENGVIEEGPEGISFSRFYGPAR
jgi:hypothetical protein